jgi:hypothetical protein
MNATLAAHLATRLAPFVPALLAAAPLPAQVPTDSVLVLQTATALYVPNYHIVDVFGGGSTTLGNQSVWSLPSPVSIATDPVAAGQFFFQTNPSSLAGTWRQEVGLLASAEVASWGAWQQQPATRVEAGTADVVTLRNGLVESVPRAGGAPATLFSQAGAHDLAFTPTHLFVASFDPSVAVPVMEWTLPSGPIRQVGNYVGVQAIAASPLAPELCLGLQNGDLVRIDVATGAVLGTTSTGLGPIVAVGYTRFGTLVWADATQVHSELVPGGPIYVSPTASIVDFGVATAPTASVTPFGSGCGLGANADWNALSLPTLGNSTFSLGVVQAPANALALLALGSSRTFSSVLSVPLPFDLAVLGAANCDLLVDPLVPLAYVTNSQGLATQIVPIPNAPTLAGIEFAAQWFVSDAAVGPLGLAGTTGVAFVVR